MFSHIAPYRSGLIASIAPWTTVAACSGLVIGDLVLSAITPGYNMVGDTSSQLMSPDARYSAATRVIVGLYAVLLVPFALGLSNHFSRRPITEALARTAIWVHIAAAIISALALNDSDAGIIGGLDANDIHDQAAMVMFGAALIVLIGFVFGHRTETARIRLLTYSSLSIMLIVGPLFVAEIWTDVNGVTERVLAASFMVWMASVAWTWRHGSDTRTIR